MKNGTAVTGRGTHDPGTRRGSSGGVGDVRSPARALLAGGLLLLLLGGVMTPCWGATEYLAVFVDGRTLKVTGARLLDDQRLRLELGGGAVVTVPIIRIDRVIEAEVEAATDPIAVPQCPTAFASEPLPAGVPFVTEIVRASKEAGLHPWLVAAVVEAESAYDPWAVSRVGARGLMQLMPAVWLENGVANPHDVKANLRAGCTHLKRLLDRFSDVALALAAYNAGAATVERASGVPPYRETREFVRRVLAKFCPEAQPPAGSTEGGGVGEPSDSVSPR